MWCSNMLWYIHIKDYYDASEEEKDPLDEIIMAFNERWFHGWDATPEDQRVKFVTYAITLPPTPITNLKLPITKTCKTANWP